jgi:hypothetical protein
MADLANLVREIRLRAHPRERSTASCTPAEDRASTVGRRP